MSDLPKYMNDVLKFPVELNGYANSIHYMTSWVFCMGVSWISDKLIVKEQTSITVVRKANTTISCVGVGIMMISLIFSGCNLMQVVVLVTIGATLKGSMYPGYHLSALDLSPNYSGTLTGIANSLGSINGIFVPYLIGILATNQTFSEWQVIFWITSGIYFVGTLNYMFFASGEVQSWNENKFLLKDRQKHEDSK